MKPTLRPYHAEADFQLIRDLLATTYGMFERPVNWRIERWNYVRHFAAPYLGSFGTGPKEERRSEDADRKSTEAIRLWESSIGVWPDSSGRVLGVVCPDEHVPWHPSYGTAHVQRHPAADALLEEMLAYAESTFVNHGVTRTWIYDHDHALEEAARKRGYELVPDRCGHDCHLSLENLPRPELPPGHRFQSMAENNSLEPRCKIFGRGFRHPDPGEWPTVFSYAELQRAPDYRKELDLVVVRPDGEYVACTVVWLDRTNELAVLEPVASIQLGMGREVVMEGLRRAAALGARTGVVGDGQRFYLAIGFERKYRSRLWRKEV